MKFVMTFLKPFLPERMKLEKVKKVVANLHDKTEYVIQIRKLKQALNHGLNLKKIYRVVKFNQEAWISHILIRMLSYDKK